jgi:hypothetical protein
MDSKEIYGSDIATAKILLDIKAVDFRPEQPFTFTSGWASPVYIDCRKLISFPAERRHVVQQAVSILGAEVGWSDIDAVAGGETAGIPYAAWIAEAADKPMLTSANRRVSAATPRSGRPRRRESGRGPRHRRRDKVNFVARCAAWSQGQRTFVASMDWRAQGPASLDVRLHFHLVGRPQGGRGRWLFWPRGSGRVAASSRPVSGRRPTAAGCGKRRVGGPTPVGRSRDE